VFYVAPHQLLKVLETLAVVLPDRQIAVARELTKLHEEMLRGTAAEVLSGFEGRAVRGEVVVIVAGVGRKPARRASRGARDDAPGGAGKGA
jgi:16S rRNA (cytidine1402-2'-O)-methyltransferase